MPTDKQQQVLPGLRYSCIWKLLNVTPSVKLVLCFWEMHGRMFPEIYSGTLFSNI